ncbi:MAG: VTT domain-containing protein [Candidatus Tectimicrobiota bacterium]
MPSASETIAVPGRNCWCIVPASRATFLIDAAAYFAAFAEAAENARRSIFILAWDLHSRTRLRPDQPSSRYPDELGPFLDALVRERRELHIYVLSWEGNIVYAFEREPLARFRFGWQTHRRLHFRQDSTHPIGASLHQKIVVIDDAIAFSGGMDLTIRRWDSPEHAVQHAQRVDHRGVPYPPFHDMQLLVDGAAARALASLARARWLQCTGQSIPPTTVVADPWPRQVQPDVTDVDVVIARSEPAYEGRAAIREVETLFLDSIAAARRCIYIENQYCTSRRILDALGARLREEHGPEVLIVGPAACTGWLEQQTVGVRHSQFMQGLQQHDRFHRLRFVYPVSSGEKPCPVFIHSKICIIDDQLARVGSANLTNRSLGLDTECDLALVSAGQARLEAAIAHLRHRLLGEHLGVEPARVREAMAARGSLLAAVDALQEAGRGLLPVQVLRVPEAESLIPEAALFDPEGPIDPAQLITKTFPSEAIAQCRWPLPRLTLVLSLLLLLAGFWHWGPLQAWLSPAHVIAWSHTIAAWPLAPLMISIGIAVGSFLMLPLTLLVVQAAFLLGPSLGFLSACTGALLSAVGAFLIGRALGGEWVQRLGTPRLTRLGQRLARRGLLAVVAIRLLPVAPFTLVNLTLGATGVTLRHFVLGTVIGLIPGFLTLSLFGDRLSQTLHRPHVSNLVLLGLLAMLLLLGGAWGVRWVQRSLDHGTEREAGYGP